MMQTVNKSFKDIKLMSKPILSIITPVYNVEHWLPVCIDSILSQSFEDWELILVDDGSSDGSGAICDEYKEKDSRIRVIHQENSGVSKARNIALEIANGKYITFVDSDDVIKDLDTFLANIKILELKNDIDILQFPLMWSDSKQCIRKTATYYDKNSIITELFKFEITGYLWGKIYKAQLFKNARCPEGISFAEDTVTLLELLRHVDKIHLSDRGCYLYMMRENSAVHTFNSKKCLDLFQMSMKFIDTIYEYTNCNNIIRIQYFFIAYQRLLDARIANNDYIENLETYHRNLINKIPSLRYISNNKLTPKNKAWLVLLKAFGFKSISWIYVKFVLLRLKLMRKVCNTGFLAVK